jgi:hypothetical protein
VQGFQKKVDAQSGEVTGKLHAAPESATRGGSVGDAELGQAGVAAGVAAAAQEEPQPQPPQPSLPTCDAGAPAQAGAEAV